MPGALRAGTSSRKPVGAYGFEQGASMYSDIGQRDKAMALLDQDIAQTPSAGQYLLRAGLRDGP